MGSLSPPATNTGLSIAESRSSREWFGCPQAHTASYSTVIDRVIRECRAVR
jgi:hypothetical protein